jgi:hypothetical protein
MLDSLKGSSSHLIELWIFMSFYLHPFSSISSSRNLGGDFAFVFNSVFFRVIFRSKSSYGSQVHHLTSTCIFMLSIARTNTELSDKSPLIRAILRREISLTNVASASLLGSSMLK